VCLKRADAELDGWRLRIDVACSKRGRPDRVSDAEWDILVAGIQDARAWHTKVTRGLCACREEVTKP